VKSRILAVTVLTVLATSCGSNASPSITTNTAVPAVSTTGPATSTTTEGAAMELTSPAFDNEAAIPVRYTCDGDNVSPEVNIAAIPQDTATLVLIMDDPDAPVGTWDHWVAYDIAPTGTIPEDVGDLGTGGINSWKQTGYGGPCPPSGTHRYFFKVLALDAPLELAEGADKTEVLAASEGHVLAEAMLMGTFAG
jgi:Raf kinase inhibitor-like YbhB/YbcL family protein